MKQGDRGQTPGVYYKYCAESLERCPRNTSRGEEPTSDENGWEMTAKKRSPVVKQKDGGYTRQSSRMFRGLETQQNMVQSRTGNGSCSVSCNPK